MDNIRYGRLDATDQEVIAAAEMADADHFIRQLPQGYDTILSERASNLSQGQRQLLAIARAILADPAILILDEATSSVDTRTEARIQAALLRLMSGRTSFVIAHRLSTIRDADHVLVIDDGRIVEEGTHADLLARRRVLLSPVHEPVQGPSDLAGWTLSKQPLREDFLMLKPLSPRTFISSLHVSSAAGPLSRRRFRITRCSRLF